MPLTVEERALLDRQLLVLLELRRIMVQMAEALEMRASADDQQPPPPIGSPHVQ